MALQFKEIRTEKYIAKSQSNLKMNGSPIKINVTKPTTTNVAVQSKNEWLSNCSTGPTDSSKLSAIVAVQSKNEWLSNTFFLDKHKAWNRSQSNLKMNGSPIGEYRFFGSTIKVAVQSKNEWLSNLVTNLLQKMSFCRSPI